MCVKCKHRVFFDPITKVLYYMDESCNKVPLPADAQVGGSDGSGVPIGGGGNPSLPPEDELPQDISGAMPCYKATGVWTVIEDFMDALVLSITGGDFSPLNPYKSFQQDYGGSLNADNFQLWKFMADHYTDDPAVGADWTEHKDAVKADFICAAQDAFEKFPLLTSGDKEWLFAYDFDSPSAVLDDFMTAMLVVPESIVWGQAASYHTFSQIGECDCVGDAPTPPPPDVPDGFTRIEWIGANSLDATQAPESIPTPQAVLTANHPGAENLTVNSWKDAINVAGTHHGLSLMFYFSHPGARITNVKFNVAWTGATADRTIHLNVSRSSALAENWTQVFERDNIAPGEYVGGVDAEFPGLSSCHFLWLNWLILGDYNGVDLIFSDVRFDIAADDGTWTRLNVLPGQLIQL